MLARFDRLAWSYPKSLLESSIIRNIFALCQSAINGQVDFIQSVIGILLHDTFSGFTKLGYGSIVPPLFQISLFIKLSS